MCSYVCGSDGLYFESIIPTYRILYKCNNQKHFCRHMFRFCYCLLQGCDYIFFKVNFSWGWTALSIYCNIFLAHSQREARTTTTKKNAITLETNLYFTTRGCQVPFLRILFGAVKFTGNHITKLFELRVCVPHWMHMCMSCGKWLDRISPLICQPPLTNTAEFKCNSAFFEAQTLMCKGIN